MITNLTIICGLTCGVLGRKQGCVFMWSVLLHTLLAIYLGVMLSPTLAGLIPALGDRNWLAASMIVTAVGLFGGVSMLALKLLSPALDYRLPEFWDQCGSGLCAFVAGFIATNFVLFMISISPLANSVLNSPHLPQADNDNPLRHATAPHVVTVCQLVSNLSVQSDRHGCRRVIDWLFEIEDTEAADSLEHENEQEETADERLSTLIVSLPKKPLAFISGLSQSAIKHTAFGRSGCFWRDRSSSLARIGAIQQRDRKRRRQLQFEWSRMRFVTSVHLVQ